MAQIPKGRLVKGPYKPICGDVPCTFPLTTVIAIKKSTKCKYGYTRPVDPMGKVDLFVLWSFSSFKSKTGFSVGISRNSWPSEQHQAFLWKYFSGWFLKFCFGLCVCDVFSILKARMLIFHFRKFQKQKRRKLLIYQVGFKSD